MALVACAPGARSQRPPGASQAAREKAAGEWFVPGEPAMPAPLATLVQRLEGRMIDEHADISSRDPPGRRSARSEHLEVSASVARPA